jgi:RNA polymerase sigma-70 factor (ECF subfamily)
LKTDTEKLIDACKKQDPKAQRMLYDRYSRMLLGICRRYCKDNMEAEDVMIQGFTKIFKQIDTYRGGNFEGWMKRVMVNEAINHFHQNKNKTWYNATDEEEAMQSPVLEVLEQLEYDELLSMIQSLPEGARVVFNLFAIEGYHHHEIAQMLGITEGTSKSQYARAKHLLKNILQKENKWKKEVI